MDNKEITDYLSKFNDFQLLTPEQEIDLAHIVQNKPDGDKERENAIKKFVECNQKLVVKYASKYFYNNNGFGIMDLISCGNVGLMKAILKYNPEKFNTRFTTYAVNWIKQAILGTLYDSGKLYHVPSNVISNSINYKKIAEAGEPISDENIMIQMDINEKDLQRIKLAQVEVVSLDKEIKGDKFNGVSSTLSDLVQDKNTKTPYELLVEEERRTLLSKVMSELSVEERELIEDRFFKDKNLWDIGEKEGVTAEAIRQRQEKTLKKMYKKLSKIII